MFREGLDNSDRQPIFRMIEMEDIFTFAPGLLLFPVKHLLDSSVPDDGDPLVIVKEPLNHIRNGINVYPTFAVSLQGRRKQ